MDGRTDRAICIDCGVWYKIKLSHVSFSKFGKKSLNRNLSRNNRLVYHWPVCLISAMSAHFFSPLARQFPLGKGFLFVEASPSHSDTPSSVGLLWTSDHPDAETSTWQRTPLTRDKLPCPLRYTNPQSQQASGHRNRPRSANTFCKIPNIYLHRQQFDGAKTRDCKKGHAVVLQVVKLTVCNRQIFWEQGMAWKIKCISPCIFKSYQIARNLK
jgi:hypothetical protein